jgi:hypothetical protein
MAARLTLAALASGSSQDDPPPPRFVQFIGDLHRVNYVAPPYQVPEVHRTIAATEQVIDNLEEELRAIKERKEQIEREQRDLKRLLFNCRSSLSPIRALPSNILLEIFQYLLPPQPDHPAEIVADRPISTSMDKKCAPWLTGSVCRSWRFLTRSTPHLWKTVSLRLSCRSTPGHGSCFALYARRMTQFLEVSQANDTQLLVYIHLADVKPDCRSFPLIMLNLAAHSYRFRSLNIRYQVNSPNAPMQPMCDLIQGLMGNTPEVRRGHYRKLVRFTCGVTFVDKAKEDVVVRYTGQNLGGFDMRHLRTTDQMRFQHGMFIQIHPSLAPGAYPWSQMRTLILQRLSAAVVLDILSLVTHVIHLELADIRPPPLGGEEVPGLSPEDLAALEVRMPAVPIKLPNLDLFAFSPPCSCILDHLVTPMVRHFRADDESSTHKVTHPTVLASVIAYLHRNPHKLNYVMFDMAVPLDQSEALFTPLENIRILEFRFNDACGFDAETCVNPDEIITLLSSTRASASDFSYMPKLAELRLRYFGPLEEQPEIDFPRTCRILNLRSLATPLTMIRSAVITDIAPDCTEWEESARRVRQEIRMLAEVGISIVFESTDEELLRMQPPSGEIEDDLEELPTGENFESGESEGVSEGSSGHETSED